MERQLIIHDMHLSCLEREVSDSGLDSCCWSDDDPMPGPAPVILQAEATHVWAAACHGQGDVTLTPMM